MQRGSAEPRYSRELIADRTHRAARGVVCLSDAAGDCRRKSQVLVRDLLADQAGLNEALVVVEAGLADRLGFLQRFDRPIGVAPRVLLCGEVERQDFRSCQARSEAKSSA